MTHKVADCLERPRARGAKLTGKHIAADDKVDSIHLSTYDSKRDRYNGYDTGEYTKVVERYEAVDAIRQVRVCGCVRVVLQGACRAAAAAWNIGCDTGCCVAAAAVRVPHTPSSCADTAAAASPTAPHRS